MKKSIYVLLALCGGMSLFADTKLDTTVISATGFDDSLANVSDNLYVIDTKELQNRGYKDLRDALKNLPGIDIVNSGTGEAIDIRGQGNKAADHVKTYIDGILTNPEDTSHKNAPINLVNIDDIAQIEVIPGGGSVMYGSGAVGGVINIITKASLKKNYANLSLKAGSFKYKSISTGIGYNFTDNFYANFGFSYLDEKGYQRADVNKLLNARLGLKYLFDNQSLGLDLSYMLNKYRNSYLITLGEDRRSDGVMTDRRGNIIATGLDQETSKNTRKTIDLKYQNDITENFQLQINPYYSEFNLDDEAFTDKKTGIKVKTRFNYDISTTYLGYEFYQDKGLRNSIAVNNNKSTSHSIYALEKLQLNDIFNIDFGARYTTIKYDIYRWSNGFAAFHMPAYTFKDNLKDHNWAANLVLGAKLNDDSKIYAKIERGFTLPTSFQLTDKLPKISYISSLIKPETYMNYELGFKGLVLNQYISATLFYTQTKDEIYTNWINHYPNPLWSMQNIGKTQRYGIEIAANQSYLDDTLELYENLSYINAKVKNDIEKSRIGKKMPQVSPFKATIGASYAMFDNKFKLRGDYSYYSKSKWYFDDEFRYTDKSLNDRKAYGLLNLGFTYSPTKNIDINFDVRNVLGEKYILNRDKISGAYQPAAKQTFYVEFKYNY